MNRGEIYRTRERIAERGDKPGYYLIVSRSFIAANDELSTVICAPIYSQILGLSTEVVVGPEEGIPKPSAARCDFLMLLAKAKLTSFAGSLTASKVASLDRAVSIAVGLR